MVLLTYLIGEDTRKLERWPLKVALLKAEEWCDDILRIANIREDLSCKLLCRCDIHGVHWTEEEQYSDRHRRTMSVTDES